MNDKKSNTLLFVILTLVIINLLGTFYIITKDNHIKSVNHQKSGLPDILTDMELESLFLKFKENYNSRNTAKLYNMLSPMVKTQLSHEKLEEQLTYLNNVINTVENGNYSHYMYLGNQGGIDTYELNYAITITDSSGQSAKGILKFTIGYDGRKYSVFNFMLLRV